MTVTEGEPFPGNHTSAHNVAQTDTTWSGEGSRHYQPSDQNSSIIGKVTARSLGRREHR